MAAERTALRCPRCGRVIAETDGQLLYIGGGIARRLITLGCAGRAENGRTLPCHGVVVWKPCAHADPHYDASASVVNR